MCGRYGFNIKDSREIINRFDLINTADELEKLKPRYNIAPGQINPVIAYTAKGNKLGRFVWGLIPRWAKDDLFKFKTINARVEGIENKAVYRKPFKSQHCLIPANFFYEWSNETNPKTPYVIKMKDDSIFTFAGLYDKWQDKESGKTIYSYTIITTTPNKLIERIHNRMPVIFTKENEKEWLNPDITEPDHMLSLLQTFPEDKLEAYPVSKAVNKPTIDDESLIKKIKV